MILKTKRCAKLTRAVTGDSNANLFVAYRRPNLTFVDIRFNVVKALNNLFLILCAREGTNGAAERGGETCV